MISLRGVSYLAAPGITESEVLRDASVDLPTADRLIILGLAGSGKTSLIRLLAGAATPQRGSIERYADLSFPVGFGGAFRTRLTVKENVCHVARLYGADVDEVLYFVSKVAEISGCHQVQYGDVSPQMRNRILYALSYAIPFQTYLIDNKPAVGDELFRRRCEQMLEERTKSAGMIMTTSFTKFAKRYGNRVAILHQSQLSMYDNFEQGCQDFDRICEQSKSSGGTELTSNGLLV